MEYWSPKGEGTAFELSPILEPLAPFKDQMLVLSGIKASWNYIHAGASGIVPDRHAARRPDNEIEIFADVSIDQLLARHFASETQLAIARAVDGHAGQCRRLHRQSELRLHAYAFVAQPDAAAADGMEPARGVRAAVRRQRQDRPAGARSAAAAAQEHPGFGDRQACESQARAGAAGPDQGRANTPTRFATSSGGSSAPKNNAISRSRRSISRRARRRFSKITWR